MPTPGGTTYTIVELTGKNVRLGGTCPSATIAKSPEAAYNTHKDTPFAYVQVRNPHAKTAVVTVYNSQAPGSGIISTVLASYARATAPTTETERKACDKGVATTGDAKLTGNSNFASLHPTDKRVHIPPGATYTMYMSAETNSATNVGSVKLNVRTDEFQ